MTAQKFPRRTLLGTALAAIASPAPYPARAASVTPLHGLCLVRVDLDGRAARLLLDTGAERSVITHGAAIRLGLRRDPWVATTLRGAGGGIERYANVLLRSAEADGNKLGPPGRAAPLSLPVTAAGLAGADGVLGADLLKQCTLDLDMTVPGLTLLPASAVTPGRSDVPLRILRQGLLLAPVRLDGRDLMALLDTGASASMVNRRGLHRLGLAPSQGGPVTTQAIGGAFATHPARFSKFEIGTLHLAAPLFLTTMIESPAYDMVLGMDVLGRQRVILSYAGARLVFPLRA
jgi:predicted aspartyl protease